MTHTLRAVVVVGPLGGGLPSRELSTETVSLALRVHTLVRVRMQRLIPTYALGGALPR